MLSVRAGKHLAMGETSASRPTETTRALFAAFVAAVVLTPIFWIVGVLHFGAITGPDPTIGRMVSYVLWTSSIGVLIGASFLNLGVSRSLGFGRACLVAAAALAPIQAASWIVTLYQWDNDEVVVISALILALAAVVLLTKRLGDSTGRRNDEHSPSVASPTH
jgi:hypothetical protein